MVLLNHNNEGDLTTTNTKILHTMKSINITTRKFNKSNGQLNKNQEWLVTIVKANGDIQSRHIASPSWKVDQETKTSGYASFYDCEKKRMSRFDLSTSITAPVAVN